MGKYYFAKHTNADYTETIHAIVVSKKKSLCGLVDEDDCNEIDFDETGYQEWLK